MRAVLLALSIGAAGALMAPVPAHAAPPLATAPQTGTAALGLGTIATPDGAHRHTGAWLVVRETALARAALLSETIVSAAVRALAERRAASLDAAILAEARAALGPDAVLAYHHSCSHETVVRGGTPALITHCS